MSDKDDESEVDPISWPVTANLKETRRLATSLPSIVSKPCSSLGLKSSSSREGPISSESDIPLSVQCSEHRPESDQQVRNEVEDVPRANTCPFVLGESDILLPDLCSELRPESDQQVRNEDKDVPRANTCPFVLGVDKLALPCTEENPQNDELVENEEKQITSKQERSCVDFGTSDSGTGSLSIELLLSLLGYTSEDQSESLRVHKDIKANYFVLGDVHTLPITHQGGTFPLHPFGPCGGEQQVECCATLEAPPGVVGSGVTVSVHYAIILDGPFVFPEKWERTSVVLYIDCPEKGLLKKPLHINLRHWAVCQPDVLAVMKADHDFTGRQREGIMFTQFSASTVSFPNAVNFYLKEHFCLICTAIEHTKLMKINSQCSSTHPINCYLMKVPDDKTALEFRIFLMYGVPSWAKAVSKYCLREDGEKIPPVVPMVLSTDSVSVILKRKEGNGWEAEMSRKELLRSKLDFSELSDLNCEEKKRGMNILAYPPYVDFLIVHKQTPTEETHFKGMNNVIFKSGLNEVNFMVVVWEAKVQSNGDRTERPSDHVHSEMPRIQNFPMPDTNDIESASNPSSVAKHPCQKSLKGAHLDKAPSDPELLKVLDKVSCWYKLAVALGVPINKANACKSSDTGGLDALCYWRDGRSGEEYPSTWKFLLDKIAERQGSTIAEEVNKYIFPNLSPVPKVMELCNSNGFHPSPS